MSLKDKLLCELCVKGKLVKSSFNNKKDIPTKRPLEFIYLNLFGPTRTKSINGKRYGLVTVNYYTIWA